MDNHIGIDDMLRDWIEEKSVTPQSLKQMESQIRVWMKRLGGLLLWLWLHWLSRESKRSKRECPHCGKIAEYERERVGVLHTMFGRIDYKRSYYRCDTCHQGHYPLDDKLGLRPNAMSAEVERLAGRVGVQMPFGKASDLFEDLTLVSLSDHSIGKATQAYGRVVEQIEEDLYRQTLDNQAMLERDRQVVNPLRLYGSLDGGRVQIRAPKGQEQPWRELKVGAWFCARGHPPKTPQDDWTIQAYDISYYSDVLKANEFGQIFWSTGVERQADQALELIILGDGARWIWDLVDLHFPQAIQIVDWFHACEYLTPVAKQAFKDLNQQQHWLQTVRDQLWKGQLDEVIGACQQHIQAQLASDKDQARQAVIYFRNNRQRMDYPTYRANGYQIGSGTIESAVKQIASQRMKVSGARWNLDNARWVAKARASFLSGKWDFLATQREHLQQCA